MYKMRNNPETASGGFSLLELLVAMAIFVMIVLMMSTIFHQSGIAWDSGTRRAQNGMTARAVLGFMARELMEAVGEQNSPLIFQRPTPTTVIFRNASGVTDSGKRTARRIQYKMLGDTITRKEDTFLANDPYQYGGWTDGSEVAIADNVKELKFEADAKWENDPVPTLPAWLRITIKLSTLDDVSSVGAESAGPDRNFASDDDNIQSF